MVDGEEAAALWRAEPEETRYVAQKRHVTTGGGFLAFEAKDLLIVTKRVSQIRLHTTIYVIAKSDFVSG